jgi:hypothetical protein
MSVDNGKVCCNCRHNIRHYEDKGGACYCDIDNHYIGYVECMVHWCRHWSKEKTENEQIADRLDDLASYIANGKVNMTMLRDSISDMRYAIAKLREEANND